jgi:hypothetical protein
MALSRFHQLLLAISISVERACTLRLYAFSTVTVCHSVLYWTNEFSLARA